MCASPRFTPSTDGWHYGESIEFTRHASCLGSLTSLLLLCLARFLFLHHKHELIEINETITVAIDLAHQLVNETSAERIYDASFSEHCFQLVIRNFPIAIAIEHTECRPADVFFEV